MKKVLWTFLITLILAVVAFFALGIIKLPASWTARYCNDASVANYDDAIEDITEAIQSLNTTNEQLQDNDEALFDAIKDIQASLKDMPSANPSTEETIDSDDVSSNQELEDASQAADEAQTNE